MEEKEIISKKIFSIIIKLRYLVLLIIAVITVFFAMQLKNLRVSGDYSFITSGLDDPEFVLTPTESQDLEVLNNIPAKINVASETSDVATPETNTSKTVQTTNTISQTSSSQSQLQNIQAAANSTSTTQNLVSTSSSTATSTTKKIEDGRNYYDGFAIVITSENLFSPEILSLISEMMEKMENYPITGPCLSPFSFVTFEKKGLRIAMIPMNPHSGYGEWTQEEADIFKERLLNDDVASNYMYNRETNTIMLYYMNEYASNEQLKEMRSFLDPLKYAGCKVAVTGLSTITERLMYYLNKDLVTLLSLCIVIILITYFLFFRSFRGVLIPFSMSVIGIIWTLGWMAYNGYQLTLVTLLTPCLVLILGSSYSIHMLSEYLFEAKHLDKDKKQLSIASCTNIYRTILLAGTTTLVGFISLTFANTQAFKDFGLCIAVGVAFCVILSLTYLPAILAIITPPKEKKIKHSTNSLFTRFVKKLSIFSTKYYLVAIIITLIIAVVFLCTKNKIQYDSNYMSYFPRTDEIIQENVYFAQTMGGTDPFYLTIRAPEGESGYFLRPDVLKKVFNYEETVLANCPDIVQSLSFTQYIAFINRIYSGTREIPDSKGMINTIYRYVAMMKNQLDTDALNLIINEDATQMTLSMRNYDSVEQDLQTTASSKRIAKVLDEYRYLLPEGTSSRISCYAYDLARGNDIVMKDQSFTTMLSFIAVFIIALIAFRSFKFSLGVMIPVAFGIMTNYVFMWLFSISFDLVTVGFSSIAIGIGIDDALHFTVRYKNRKKEAPHESVQDRLQYTIQRTGKPIIETTVAIVAGMLALCFGSYAPIKYFGLIMCITLLSTNLATLFALPAYLITTDKK